MLVGLSKNWQKYLQKQDLNTIQ